MQHPREIHIVNERGAPGQHRRVLKALDALANEA
jgi:hypothetical protein